MDEYVYSARMVREACKLCNGTGYLLAPPKRTCVGCGGSGVWRRREKSPSVKPEGIVERSSGQNG